MLHLWSKFDPNLTPEYRRNWKKKKSFSVKFASPCTNGTNTVLLSEGDKFLWYVISVKFIFANL